jgi:RHS repeat-associated protein
LGGVPAGRSPSAGDGTSLAPFGDRWVGSGPVQVAAEGVGAGSVSRVRVEVLDPTAVGMVQALRPMVIRVARADGGQGAGRVRVRVDYRAFAEAYGADWATRLRLGRLPDCALATPEAAGCQPQSTGSRNDTSSGTVTAEVNLVGASGAALVLLAGSAGAAGDYGATPLSPSSTWSAGGSSGDFSWSYPMRTPPAAGGPAPQLALAYSSQSVDGRHAATNNQPSWIGEGFEFNPGGFIERRYIACGKDMDSPGHNNTTKTGDLCWKTSNATVSLSGHSGELLYNSSDDSWHLRNDDGSRVEKIVGGPGYGNGDNNGEYWKLTTTDGTQYFFGRHKLSGWTTGKPVTNSVFAVPVFGNNPDEPCHESTFAASSCSQAWRWNLDYVVDTHGNTMSLWYTRESNKYGRNNTISDAVTYTRGGYPSRIDYGTSNRGGTDTAYTTGGVIPGRVEFTTADRCLSGCSTHGASWPDTPWDQECTGSSCSIFIPTFWTTKRLSQVNTRVWNAATSAFRDVESWTLTHSFPSPGDSTRAGLWLDRIGHSGLSGGTATVPDITLDGVSMNNRVDPGLYGPGMAWRRLQSVMTETGALITIDYSSPDCTPASLPSPSTNTRRCFPSRWTPPGYANLQTDWFHKYVVTQITETDLTGATEGFYSSPTVLHRYDYPEPDDPDPTFRQGAAWHYTDDDGLVDDDTKTWSAWRGYDRIREITGQAPEARTFVETRYMRGMHGDKLSSGTRTVQVGNSQNSTTVPDEDWWAGQVREQIVYNGPGGQEVSGVINVPWASDPTASRTLDGLTVHARFTGVEKTMARTDLAAGGHRRAESVTTFDQYGQTVAVDDAGDLAVSGDERCARTAYAYNSSAWLLSYPKQVRVFARPCTAVNDPLPASVGEADVISETRTSYDGEDWGTPPTDGDATRSERASAWTAGIPTDFVATTASYDPQGRVVDVADPLGRHTSTTYTPTAGGPLTKTVITNPAGHETTVELDPAFGTPRASIDANGKRTDLTMDPLGRITEVFEPGRVKGTHTPSARYTYAVSATAATFVRSEVLQSNATTYATGFTLYDGLLRPRQDQSAQPTSGRVITEVFYDSVGRPFKRYGPYLDNAAPTGTLFAVEGGDSTVNGLVVTTEFDGVSRPVAEITRSTGVTELWRTSYSYGGDRLHTTPPSGGTATTTVSDVRGNTIALRQYRNPVDVGSTNPNDYLETGYQYNSKGQLAGVVDAAGNQWSAEYDLLGRMTANNDPDKGTVTSVYDDAGQLSSTTDALGSTVAYEYDALGRRTEVWDNDTVPPTQRAEMVYDTVTNGKGQLASWTRWQGENEYTYAIGGYNNFYQPTSATFTIPATETGLAGSYQYLYTYTGTGGPATTRYPAIGSGAGALPTETVTTTRTSGQLALPYELRTNLSGLGQYVTSTTYTSYGELATTTYQTNTVAPVQTSNIYEQFTRRLSRTQVNREVSPGTVADVHYTYDAAGNITAINDTRAGDPQCFRYDHLRRLTDAWTPLSGDCTAAPSAGSLGGPAPYWLSWQMDDVGNRQSQTRHDPAGDTTTNYTYPAAGSPRPHALLSTSTTGPAGTSNSTYSYDDAGNVTGRPTSSSGQQTLAWDTEGRLASTADTSGSTSYLYDPNGNRLIRRDPAGSTLYLPDQELRYTPTTGAKSGTRYYRHNGALCATRTPAGIKWLISDRQGTVNITIDPATQAVTQRRQDPYGNPRGSTTGTWPASMDKGFVGGTQDPTGLTHLGAREYEPETGRFMSVDPVLTLTNPQQWNAYAYANNSPVTLSDPSGLEPGSWCNTSQCTADNEKKQTKHPSAPNSKKCDNANSYASHYCSGSTDSAPEIYANQVYIYFLRMFNDAVVSTGESVDPGWVQRAAMAATQEWADEQCAAGVEYACDPLEQQPAGPDLPLTGTCEGSAAECVGGILLMLLQIATQALAMAVPGGKGMGKAPKLTRIEQQRQAALRKATTPSAIHDAYVERIADWFRQRGLKVVTERENARETTLTTPSGKERRFDMVVTDANGKRTYIEVKSNNAGKKTKQVEKDIELEQQGYVINYVFDQLPNVAY